MTSCCYSLCDNKEQSKVTLRARCDCIKLVTFGSNVKPRVNLLECHHFFSFCVSSDTEPPQLQCPADIVAETDERRGTANVSWNVPTAVDNSNEEVKNIKI